MNRFIRSFEIVASGYGILVLQVVLELLQTYQIWEVLYAKQPTLNQNSNRSNG